jgi:glycosyltransferase involved in cell wall biosynthesis
MYQGARVAVLVPAYNEAGQIGRVIASMPDYVDHVVVVDDASTDGTGDVVEGLLAEDPRITLFRLPENRGVGGALAVAYSWARDQGVDVAVTVDGDGQMDPADMWRLLDPIVDGRADFTKGNRLTTLSDLSSIPRLRLLGNVVLSLLTKIATGYWSLADSQSGYSAAGRYALEQIAWNRVYARYGRPNDAIWHASMAGCRVADVPIRSVYGVGEKSTMKILRTSWSIAWLLFRRFWQRMFVKHILIDFHPMVFLYAMALVATIAVAGLLPWVVVGFVNTGRFPQLASFALIVSVATAVNATFLAFFMDLHAHRHVSLPLQLPAGHRARPGPDVAVPSAPQPVLRAAPDETPNEPAAVQDG